MKVLKFGGGCLKDAGSIKKIPSILKKHDKNIIIVISAFGKLTNLLEDISSKNPIDFNQAKILLQTSRDEDSLLSALNSFDCWLNFNKMCVGLCFISRRKRNVFGSFLTYNGRI